MPTLLRAGPYRLFMFAENVGYSPREIHRIRKVVESERLLLILAIDTVCERARR